LRFATDAELTIFFGSQSLFSGGWLVIASIKKLVLPRTAF